MKRMLALWLITLSTLSYSKRDLSIVRDSMADAESYKVEKPVEEADAQRSVAGAKIKKKTSEKIGDEPAKNIPIEPGSEVRHWQYSE
jgi:hypothetical protein